MSLEPRHLTDSRLHDLALDARAGLRECLKMIELHGRDSRRSFLNPPIVLTAAATWERFTANLACAAIEPDWTLRNAGVDRKYDECAWPVLRKGASQGQSVLRRLDTLLVDTNAMPGPLTPTWKLLLAGTGKWKGADATEWRWVECEAEPAKDHRVRLRRALLGAHDARDAVGHRLYYKKARESQGQQWHREQRRWMRPGHEGSDSDVDSAQADPTSDRGELSDHWRYVWASDNTDKSATERPTLQHGYARGVVAMFIQLVDQTIVRVADANGWGSCDIRLHSHWFRVAVPDRSSQPCAGMQLWNGEELYRARS